MAAEEYGNDAALLADVLRVYKPNCRYLRSAGMVVRGQPGEPGGGLTVRGTFHVPESCYIDDTGHFNAVEFVICFNQIGYLMLAKSVKERALRALDGWTMDDYWARQLGDMFIVDMHSAYRRAIRGRSFWGELDVTDVVERDGGNGPLLILSTRIRFGESEPIACHGRVRIAVRIPPRPGAPS
ncbi:FcoT family thioesterase [Streptomyces litchfieldiae]|uniref:(2E)-enoyl-[ACP] glycyltransferase n=1 Tax=Streptomyces litchfieldiae TaxID=3075543 RepID=A0ABU2MVP7_9ACTN|nr:FcoT family thioesterase [Streptomyces sp. DSM 44938]MDT0345373.1 FcoT family thioesterase [Streptomyces sp. DSM 44938]